MIVAVKTVRWQCSGCDHLCALLLDGMIGPRDIVKCELAVWRIIGREEI